MRWNFGPVFVSRCASSSARREPEKVGCLSRGKQRQNRGSGEHVGHSGATSLTLAERVEATAMILSGRKPDQLAAPMVTTGAAVKPSPAPGRRLSHRSSGQPPRRAGRRLRVLALSGCIACNSAACTPSAVRSLLAILSLNLIAFWRSQNTAPGVNVQGTVEYRSAARICRESPCTERNGAYTSNRKRQRSCHEEAPPTNGRRGFFDQTGAEGYPSVVVDGVGDFARGLRARGVLWPGARTPAARRSFSLHPALSAAFQDRS